MKPCATCHHAKSKHRRHECRVTWQTRATTFMGINRVTQWCRCEGYVETVHPEGECDR